MALASLTSTGCSVTERLNAAAVDIGTAQARVTLPAQPADCNKREPHAKLNVGLELRSALDAERRSTTRANDRVQRCYELRENVARALK